MLRSLVTSCLISVCFLAGGQAQDTSQSAYRPITTVTLQSTITVVPIAFTTPTEEYLPAPPSPTCDVGSVTCPACDGEHVDVDGGNAYRIHCDAGFSSNTSALQPAYITPRQCLVVCDSASDCVGTTLAANGSCVLTTGPDYLLGSSTGEVAFEQIRYVPVNSTGTSNSSASNSTASDPLASKFFSSATIPLVYPTAYLNASNTPVLNLPKPYYTNFTLPNATHPVNSSIPINSTCSSANPTCPACDNQTIADRHNVTYTVLCGYSLDATLDYASAEPLPATYCMSRCDERNTTCLGASWSTEECVLALGPYVKVADPNHIAFIRAAIPAPYPVLSTGSLPRPPISTGLSYLNMSRYDGSIFPQPTLVATNPIAQPPITATDPIAGTGYTPAPTPPASDIPTTTARGLSFTSLPTGASAYPEDPFCYYLIIDEIKSFVCQRGGVTSPGIPVEGQEYPTAVALSAPAEEISAPLLTPVPLVTPVPVPSQGLPESPYGGFKGPWGGSPPWAHGDGGGDYGVDEGSRHHKPQGSWWQGGRPQWSHWGWGKPGARRGQK